jgi:lipopolysaccharide transport system permease protein
LLANDFDLVLEPPRGLIGLRLKELARFRELLYFFTWRDLKVRYKQTALGVAWAVLQPVLTMVLFTVIFGHVAKISSEGVPYPLFSYAALVPWFFFANSIQLSSNSLTLNPQLITKTYFPRLYLVLAPILASLVDFALALLVLFGLIAYYEVSPDAGAVFALVPLLLLAFAATVGLGSFLAALNVRYRDVRFIVPFLVQVLLFASPIVYSITTLHEPWRTVYGINPMASVVQGFRWALAGGAAPGGLTILVSTISAVLLLVLGLGYFSRTERQFADVI